MKYLSGLLAHKCTPVHPVELGVVQKTQGFHQANALGVQFFILALKDSVFGRESINNLS